MKKTYGKKNDGLLRQYPFLAEFIHDRRMLPWQTGGVDTKISIGVEIADGDLMWKMADNVGLPGDNALLIGTKGPYDGLVGSRGEYLAAIDVNNEVLQVLEWPRTRHGRRKKSNFYANAVLWQERDDKGWYSNPYPEETLKYLVWVTVKSWHVNTKDESGEPGSRFGKQVIREIVFTVFGKPDEGFRKLGENSRMANHLFLSEDLHSRAIFDENRDVLGLFARLEELCQFFQDDVWFSGMRDVFVAGDCRGASGAFGPVTVLCGELCGYERLTLRDSSCWITFQCREEGDPLYVQAMGGTLPRIRTLVKTVIQKWNTCPECRASFGTDREISFL